MTEIPPGVWPEDNVFLCIALLHFMAESERNSRVRIRIDPQGETKLTHFEYDQEPHGGIRERSCRHENHTLGTARIAKPWLSFVHYAALCEP